MQAETENSMAAPSDLATAAVPTAGRWRKILWMTGIAVLVLNCLPLLFLPTYPFIDLPNHLAEATIFQARNDPASPLTAAFSVRLPWYQPTVGHTVICSLFPSVETGNTLLYLLYVISLPLLVALIARRCEGDAVIAFLAVIAIWNYNATWGFAGFTMAIPFVLLYLYLHLRFLTERTVAVGLCLAITFLLTYWMHVLAFLFVMLCFTIIEIGRAIGTRRWRALLAAPLPAILPCIMLGVWIASGEEFGGQSTLGFLKEYYTHDYLSSLAERTRLMLVRDQVGISYTNDGMAIAIAFALLLTVPALFAIWRLVRGRCQMSAARWATLAFTAAAFACYMVLPDKLPGEPCLYERYSVLVILGVVCVLTWSLPMAPGELQSHINQEDRHSCLSKTASLTHKMTDRNVCPPDFAVFVPMARSNAFCATALFAAMAYSLLWFNFFLDFYGVSHEFRNVFPRSRDVARSTMAAVIGDAKFRDRDTTLIHYNNYQIIWNHGLTPTRLADYRFGVVRPTDERLPKYKEGACRLSPTELAALIDSRYSGCQYLLVRGDETRSILERRPDYIQIKSSHNWAVFQKKP